MVVLAWPAITGPATSKQARVMDRSDPARNSRTINPSDEYFALGNSASTSGPRSLLGGEHRESGLGPADVSREEQVVSPYGGRGTSHGARVIQ